MKTPNTIEADINQIRLKIYEQEKNMTPAQRVERVNRSAEAAFKRIGYKLVDQPAEPHEARENTTRAVVMNGNNQGGTTRNDLKDNPAPVVPHPSNCRFCGCLVEQQGFPPKLLKPAYFVILSCYPSIDNWAPFLKKNYSFKSWCFFGGILTGFWDFSIIQNTPVCRRCCRSLSLVSIAIYMLILSCVSLCFIEK